MIKGWSRTGNVKAGCRFLTQETLTCTEAREYALTGNTPKRLEHTFIEVRCYTENRNTENPLTLMHFICSDMKFRQAVPMLPKSMHNYALADYLTLFYDIKISENLTKQNLKVIHLDIETVCLVNELDDDIQSTNESTHTVVSIALAESFKGETKLHLIQVMPEGSKSNVQVAAKVKEITKSM